MMQGAQVNGAELAFEEIGVGTGEPVIGIHGALVADTFRSMAVQPILRDRYRFILYHRRGYAGSSRSAGPTTIEREAGDCRGLLHHLGVQSAHVVGHSLGGVVAIEMALADPDLVRSLALLEPALMIGASAHGYRDSLAQGVERFRAGEPAAVVHAFLEARWPAYRATLDREAPGGFDQAVTDAATSFECEFPAILNWRFDELRARRITQPTLSVLGGESGAHSPRFEEVHRSLLAWAPDAEGFVLPGATHFLQVQDPVGMAEALVDFWTRHPIEA